MGHNHLVSGDSKSIGISQVDGLSTGPRDLGCYSYNPMRYSEPTDNILPHELDDVLAFDGGEGLSLYPFSKIVGGNQQ